MIMIELAVPVLVFFLMFIIGASLDKNELKNIRHIKKQVIAITLGQMLLLPFCAWLIIQVMQPSSLVAVGMLLVSLCPGGAVSNIYCFLAKANVALSVALTAFNGLASILVLPLMMLIVFPSLLGVDSPLENIIFKQGLQLMLLLFLPVIIGMSLRQIKPHLTCKMMPTFEKIGAIGLLFLLISIFYKFHQKIEEQLSSLLVLALTFTLASLLIAYCLSYFLKLTKKDEAAVVIEFPVRNLALAALLAVSIFENSDYLLFAAVFFVIQTPIILLMVARYRSSFFNTNSSLKTKPTT